MRIGATWLQNSNAFYRAVEPMRAMARRGHEIVWPDPNGASDLGRLQTCDVVHVYRGFYPRDLPLMTQLAERGVKLVYDNDDDLSAIPEESELYKKDGHNRERNFARTVELGQLAAVVTTTTDWLADRYGQAGLERVEVVPNSVGHQVHRPRVQHDGVVVGWIGGEEHVADIARIDVTGALERLLSEHPDVRVHAIGTDLGVSQRYEREIHVDFPDLPKRMGRFDIGIAPLADLAYNYSRSDIKLREYAASGVPWLASPIGPYAGLGEDQGGRLVADDEWFEALHRLVTRPRDRKRLAKKGAKWAKSHTIERYADRWEAVFQRAAASG